MQLVDRVFPNVPIRQWVVSLSWELRRLAATKRGVLGAMNRIFAEEIGRLTRRLAGVADAQTGSVGCPQMFGGSLNLHPHLHTLAVDGVFEKTDGGGVRFHEAPAPSKDDVSEVAKRVRERAVRWLRRHGYVDERAAEERSNETPEPSAALDACTQLALAGGAFLARPLAPREKSDADLNHKERRFSATCDGFDVHCAVRLAADDDQGRERLVRYCTRPPFALDRIEVLPDKRIAYLLKVPRKGRTHPVMTPMEFMARLAALIPPPRIPLVRYHGVFAPRSSWRARVTPKPPAHAAKPCAAALAHAAKPCAAALPASTPAPASAAASLAVVPASPAVAPALAVAVAGGPMAPEVVVDPTMLSVAHWGRLESGELFARARYVERSVLMKRTWGFDVLHCPRCAKKMRVLSTITDPATIRRILEHLGVRADPLPRAPARDPTWEQVDLGFDNAAA
ncbi:transposase [Sorangium sp. So ce117]|uniref:transposase n=1 Tax=Sorangium sp. So ce117 TaxID=3133277 RepID=UPI003F5E4882